MVDLVKCEVCGRNFKVISSRVKTAKFCSRKCTSKWRSQTYKGKGNPRYGCHLSKETKHKISNGNRKLKVSKKQLILLYWKRNLSTSKIADMFSVNSETVRNRMVKLGIKRRLPSHANDGKKFSDKHRNNIAQARLRNWKDPKYRTMITSRVWKACRKRPTKLEQKFMDIINKWNLPFRYCGNGKVVIDGKSPDFISTNGEKKLIEVFGEVFHNPNKTFMSCISYHQTEHGRIEFFKQHGYDCIVLWEHEINSSTEQELVEKIRQFCSTPQILNTTVYD